MKTSHTKRNLILRVLVGGKWWFVLAGVFIVSTFVVVILDKPSNTVLAQQEQARPSEKAGPADEPPLAPSPEPIAETTPPATQTAVSADSEKPTVAQETERQKEQRLAVEQERAARGTTVKTLKTKLAEAEKSSSNDPLQLTFDDLVFPMEKKDNFKRSMLSEDHDRLDQRKVSISGYIRPSARQSGLTKFVFVRDNMECCFGPGAALYDCILVKLANGRSTDYTVRPVTIEGNFYIKEFTGPNGKTWAIFRMKNGQVK